MTINDFNEIYNQHWWTIFNFAKVKLHAFPDYFYAEEVTSHVFIQLWDKQPEFEKPNLLKHWLYVTANRKIIDTIRHESRQVTDPITYNLGYLSSEDEEELERLEIAAYVMQYALKAIKDYSKREKQIFDLHFIKELSVGKVSQILNTKPQTIHNQLTTLKSKLRLQIKRSL